MSTKSMADFWPRPISHLNRPPIGDSDVDIVIAEITDGDQDGFQGMRQMFTCLVPYAEIDAVVSAEGGIGWNVESWGPGPVVSPDGGYDSSFWVEGVAGSKQRYEPLVHSWLNHNQTVMTPDNGLLMCYGLVPRMVENSRLIWDDPGEPVYDVIEVSPLSVYQVPNKHSQAYVRIRREYLADYASLKGCCVVSVFYEQRLSKDDSKIASVLDGGGYSELKLPGRLLDIRTVEPGYFFGNNQLTQIWGCRLLLKPDPKIRPITEPARSALIWPNGKKINQFDVFEEVYVKDDVLATWESRDEYTIMPTTGGVSYGGWWSTARSHRVGRHHIAFEARKLYEGLSPSNIERFHKFAVGKADVERDVSRYGERNVGKRADDVIQSFLRLIRAIAELSSAVGIPTTDSELANISSQHIRYNGWWRLRDFKKLGNVISLNLTEDAFLDRSMDLYQLIERLRSGPLKGILAQLGMKAEDFKSLGEVGALRLLGTICQLTTIAKDAGLDLVSDFETVKKSWNKDTKLQVMAPLFGINGLRVIRGHVQGADRDKRWRASLAAFDIDPSGMKAGWGTGLDTLYDKLAAAFDEISDLLEAAVV